MSNEIQSISQGNYILQGTVATSAGIVGDGTTQNPLRADETVLYSGAGTSGDFTLTEDPLNFNRIRVEYNSTNETINASTHDMGVGEFNFDPSKTTNIILETVFIYTPSANNAITALNHGFAAYYNTQTTAWNRKMGGWTNKWAVGSPTTISADRHFVFVNKVVGINRKAQ